MKFEEVKDVLKDLDIEDKITKNSTKEDIMEYIKTEKQLEVTPYLLERYINEILNKKWGKDSNSWIDINPNNPPPKSEIHDEGKQMNLNDIMDENDQKKESEEGKTDTENKPSSVQSNGNNIPEDNPKPGITKEDNVPENQGNNTSYPMIMFNEIKNHYETILKNFQELKSQANSLEKNIYKIIEQNPKQNISVDPDEIIEIYKSVKDTSKIRIQINTKIMDLVRQNIGSTYENNDATNNTKNRDTKIDDTTLINIALLVAVYKKNR